MFHGPARPSRIGTCQFFKVALLGTQVAAVQSSSTTIPRSSKRFNRRHPVCTPAPPVPMYPQPSSLWCSSARRCPQFSATHGYVYLPTCMSSIAFLVLPVPPVFTCSARRLPFLSQPLSERVQRCPTVEILTCKTFTHTIHMQWASSCHVCKVGLAATDRRGITWGNEAKTHCEERQGRGHATGNDLS